MTYLYQHSFLPYLGLDQQRNVDHKMTQTEHQGRGAGDAS